MRPADSYNVGALPGADGQNGRPPANATGPARALGAIAHALVGPALASRLSGRSSEARSERVRYFSVATFIVMSVVAVVVISAFQIHQSSTLLRLAEAQNSALARSFANTVWLTHAGYVTTIRAATGDELRARRETKEIDVEVRRLAAALPVLKVKIYSAPGLTIYSSEAGQIGEDKSDNTGFRAAVGTGAPVSKMSFRGSFSAFSGIVSHVDLAESYVPVLDANGNVEGVFELYTDISPHVATMRFNNWVAAIIVLVSSLGMYLSLLQVTRRADQVLRRQNAELMTANEDLKAARNVARALNMSLEEKLHQLKRSNGDLQDFARIAAHDLQEPLRKLEVFGTRLVGKHAGALPEDALRNLERMQEATVRMRRLVTDMLSFTRLSQSERSFTRVDLDAVLKRVLADLKGRIEATGAEIKVGRLPMLEANEGQMRQLLHNLLDNALKFRRQDVRPSITIAAAVSTDNGLGCEVLKLSIADNGVGFDNAFNHKLFTLFQRLHSEKDLEGTGLGLAICRRIVTSHHGTISADGRPGHGATFSVQLRMSQGVKAASLPARGKAREVPASRPRRLVSIALA